MLDVETLKQAAPKGLQSRITPALVRRIDQAITDPEMKDALEDNILGYMSAIRNSRVKIEDYVNAVKYVTFKTMGDDNLTAWTKVFPERYQRLLQAGATSKQIHSHSSMYARAKILVPIFEQAMIPTHLFNADVFQEAINTQASIMRDPDVSPMVRTTAANSLIVNLKPPEASKVEIDVNVNEGDAIRELRNITRAYAQETVQRIESGSMSAGDAARQVVVQPMKEVQEVGS